jgi:hypothetical protein
VSEGEDADVAASAAPDTPQSLNMAGKVDTKIKMDDAARAHLDAAMERNRAGDGKACIKELDAYDKANRNATQLSTNPNFYYAQVRAQCVMQSGNCDAGKAQLRKAMQAQQGSQMGPEMIDNFVDMTSAKFCTGGKLSPRDQLLAAASTLSSGMMMKKLSPADCSKAYETVKRLGPTVTPKDEMDFQVKQAVDARQQATNASACLAHAGDCQTAYKLHVEGMRLLYGPSAHPSLLNEEHMRKSFEGRSPACKGK